MCVLGYYCLDFELHCDGVIDIPQVSSLSSGISIGSCNAAFGSRAVHVSGLRRSCVCLCVSVSVCVYVDCYIDFQDVRASELGLDSRYPISLGARTYAIWCGSCTFLDFCMHSVCL